MLVQRSNTLEIIDVDSDSGNSSAMALPVDMSAAGGPGAFSSAFPSGVGTETPDGGGGGSAAGVKKVVVSMKNGSLSYGKGRDRKEVLNDLTMTVEQGTMYVIPGFPGFRTFEQFIAQFLNS